RLREGLHTLWRRGLTRRLPGGDAACISGQDIPYLLVRQPAQTRRPQRGQQGGRLLPVGIVGRVDDLLRADEPVEAEQVELAPDRRVEEDAGLAADPVCERCEAGDAGVRDDQLCLRKAI